MAKLETTKDERIKEYAAWMRAPGPTRAHYPDLQMRLIRDVDALEKALDRRAGAAHDFAVALGREGYIVGHDGGFGNCRNGWCIEARAVLGDSDVAETPAATG